MDPLLGGLKEVNQTFMLRYLYSFIDVEIMTGGGAGARAQILDYFIKLNQVRTLIPPT